MKSSKRITEIPMSGIRKMFDLAGPDSINLGLGEPDLTPPVEAIEGMCEASRQGKNKYGPTAGIPELRNAVADYFSKYGEMRGDNIMITPSGSTALLEVTQSMIDPGDEVLIPSPGFVIYSPHVRLAGGIPVEYKLTDDGTFQPDIGDIISKITPKTTMIIVNTPSNPTGGVLTQESKDALVDMAWEHDITILSDEVYCEFIYEGEHISFMDSPECAVVVNGFSKSYAMTGWRLGWAMGPKELMRHICKIHQFGIMSAPTTAQFAGIEAIRTGDDDIARMRDQYDLRRRYLLGELRSMGLECFEPEGAFYIFPSIESTGLSSEEFCERLLHEQEVAVIPGSAFGASGEGHIRISYSYSMSHLREACSRMKIFLENLKQE